MAVLIYGVLLALGFVIGRPCVWRASGPGYAVNIEPAFGSSQMNRHKDFGFFSMVFANQCDWLC